MDGASGHEFGKTDLASRVMRFSTGMLIFVDTSYIFVFREAEKQKVPLSL